MGQPIAARLLDELQTVPEESRRAELHRALELFAHRLDQIDDPASIAGTPSEEVATSHRAVATEAADLLRLLFPGRPHDERPIVGYEAVARLLWGLLLGMAGRAPSDIAPLA